MRARSSVREVSCAFQTSTQAGRRGGDIGIVLCERESVAMVTLFASFSGMPMKLYGDSSVFSFYIG